MRLDHHDVKACEICAWPTIPIYFDFPREKNLFILANNRFKSRMDRRINPPLALTIISSIFISVAGVVSL